MLFLQSQYVERLNLSICSPTFTSACPAPINDVSCLYLSLFVIVLHGRGAEVTCYNWPEDLVIYLFRHHKQISPPNTSQSEPHHRHTTHTTSDTTGYIRATEFFGDTPRRPSVLLQFKAFPQTSLPTSVYVRILYIFYGWETIIVDLQKMSFPVVAVLSLVLNSFF